MYRAPPFTPTQNNCTAADPLPYRNPHHNYDCDFARSEDEIGGYMHIDFPQGYMSSFQTLLRHRQNVLAIVLEHLQVILRLSVHFRQVLCNHIGEGIEA